MERVAGSAEIEEGKGCTVTVDGRAVAIFRCRGALYAIDDVCPHRGGPLGEGDLEGDAVVCPLHGWSFSLSSGEMVGMPNIRVATFEVEERDGNVFVGPAR
jgi:NAD(P)H-dependent nitrite reductase small subunit